MDRRLQKLADQLDAGLIARREFLRTSAVITGGTAAGLHALSTMAHAQSGTKLRVWLFKSFVTSCNDVLAKQIEAWGAERKVQVEMDWATFGDREQKFVAAIEAGNPRDRAGLTAFGPMRYRAALATSPPWVRTSPMRAGACCRTPRSTSSSAGNTSAWPGRPGRGDSSS